MNEKKILKQERFILDADEYEALNKKRKESWKDFADFEIVKSEREYTHVNNTDSVGSVVLNDDEEGEKYYAEEVYDEGEEAVFDDIHDSEIVVEKRLSYKDIVDNLNQAFASFDFKSETLGLDLLANMQFYRLINLKPSNNIINEVNALFDALDNPKFVVDCEEENNIAANSLTMEFLNYAKEKPFKAVYVFIRGASSKNIFKYIRPFYPYIDNPNGDCFISTQNKSLYIPHNIYFLTCLDKDDVIYDVSRRLLRYMGTMNSDLTLGKDEGNHIAYPLNITDIVKASRDANDEYGVSESSWKKLDNIIELVHKVNNYTLENKISRRIEDFVVVYLANGQEEDNALDVCLANDVFQELIVTTRPNLFLNEYNLSKEINGQFGNNRMALTKETVSNYLNLFDKGGNRKDG